MSGGVLAMLAPPYGEERRIVLSLADPTVPTYARRPVRLLVDASQCDPPSGHGLVLPIEITITGPRGEVDFVRIIDRRLVRSSLTFTPRTAGRHTVVMRETAHNRWWGALDVDVVGDRAQDPEP